MMMMHVDATFSCDFFLRLAQSCHERFHQSGGPLQTMVLARSILHGPCRAVLVFTVLLVSLARRGVPALEAAAFTTTSSSCPCAWLVGRASCPNAKQIAKGVITIEVWITSYCCVLLQVEP